MLEEEFKEVLGELINIAFGSATATIADLFDNFATLHVPDITLTALEEINEFVMGRFGDQKIYVTTQQFKGQFQGEIILAIDPQSAHNMQDIIGEGDEDENSIQQSILEISNILGSSCIGRLAELLVTNVTFAPPSIDYDKMLIKDVNDSPYSQVIVISTVLEFKETEIIGKLFIMFSDEMFVWLEQALADFMENI